MGLLLKIIISDLGINDYVITLAGINNKNTKISDITLLTTNKCCHTLHYAFINSQKSETILNMHWLLGSF